MFLVRFCHNRVVHCTAEAAQRDKENTTAVTEQIRAHWAWKAPHDHEGGEFALQF